MTIDVTIQNPAHPGQVHVLPMKDINNAMCAILALDLAFTERGLTDRKKPLLWFDTQEIGIFSHVRDKRWCRCQQTSDGRWVKGGEYFSQEDLTDRTVLIGRLSPGIVEALPEWIWTWAAEADL